MRKTLGIAVLAVVLGLTLAAAHAAEKYTVVGSNHMDLVVLEGDTPGFTLDVRVIGKGWMLKSRLAGKPTVADGKTRVFEQKKLPFFRAWAPKPTGPKIDLRCEVDRAAPDAVRIRFTSSPDAETQYALPNDGIGIGPVIGMTPYFVDGKCHVVFADGKTQDLPYPVPRGGRSNVREIRLVTASGDATILSFEPAIFLHTDHNEIRMFASPEGKTPAGGTMTQLITLKLPAASAFEPGNRWVDTSDWFVYEHKNDFSPGSVIGVEDWLDKPAGSHGWLKVDGDHFTFADGTRVKFFATNISWDDMACPPEQADMWNDKWAKHGVNLVRLHKFINHDWAGIMTPEDHMVPDPEKVKLFDYYHASARKRGIYLGWSAVFHMKLTPADKTRVKYFEEVRAHDPKHLDVLGLKNIAPDIQDLLIKQTVNLVDRKNTVTGIRYADDPALAYIELHNEDDIFFPFDNFRKLEKNFPKYFADFQNRFGQYLKKKYGSQEALEKAWGRHYPKGKRLEARPPGPVDPARQLLEKPAEPVCEIRPSYDSWQINHGNVTPVAVDTMYFMYLEQSGFYKRFVKALREAGYQGAITGGCWQASCWLGHLYNTLTDYEVGFIDRHNYSGTPLNRPGVGNMSAGFQQVRHRPFNFSEWGGGPEGVPTVAVYGLGLQGWDASCQFSSKSPGIYNIMKRGVNGCCDDLVQIGQYPALSRMVLRGDVKEGDLVAVRKISIPGLFKGDVGLYEHFSLLGGGANTKEFSSVVPATALMAGRVVLEYIDEPVPENPVTENVAKYIDDERKIVRSTTGQLLWDYSGRGFYTVNTPGTQAVIGYVPGRKIELDDVTILTDLDAAAKLYVSTLEKDKPIREASRLLITTFGRDANTGMVFDEFAGRPLEEGQEPLRLEPVRATITLKRNVKAVYPLDHSGRMRPDAPSVKLTSSPDGSTFTLDGKTTKTMYYLVELK